MARPAHTKAPALVLLVARLARRTAFGALGLLAASCAKAPAESAGAPDVEVKHSTAAPEAPPSGPRDAPVGEEQLSVPEAVARLHRDAFREAAVDPKLGRVLCFVTLHDAALKRGELFPLVLFTDGSIATWRQTAAGRREPFLAKLSAEEHASTPELIEAIPKAREMARETFRASSLVMGVSVRVNEQVETLYFNHDQIPRALGHLVALLKQRLEATNRQP